MNNHYFRVVLMEKGECFTVTIKSAKDLNDAANQAVRRARKAGATDPTVQEVGEHLLTLTQRPNIDS